MKGDYMSSIDISIYYIIPAILILSLLAVLVSLGCYIYDVIFNKEIIVEKKVVKKLVVDDNRIFDVLDKIIDVEYENVVNTKLMLRAVNSMFPGGRFKSDRININNEIIMESCDIIEKNVIESMSQELKDQFGSIFDSSNRSLETYIYTKVYNRMLRYAIDLNINGNSDSLTKTPR